MSKQYPGGLITKTPVTPNTSSASGIWTLDQQSFFKKINLWPISPRVPGAPTIGTATAGNTTATVTFTAPADTGFPNTITSFTATSNTNISSSNTTSPITVTGLTNNVNVTFTVTATNATGNSAPSAASNGVTPVVPPGTVAEYLVVAGGGGGSGGGGGAGGMLTAGPGTATFSGTYTVTIGAGGAFNAQTTGNASPGANTVLTGATTFTAVGGGYGGGGYTVSNGGNGGSGGGGSLGSGSTPSATGGTATSGQGNAGGNATAGSYYGWVAGGGGGAGAAGGSATNYDTGNSSPFGPLGGAGAASSITGSAVTYAAGAQAYYSNGVSADGTANSGNGGGGSKTQNLSSDGWNGGSGVVIIAYPDSYPALTSIGGGLTYNEPSRSGYRVYRFTAGTGSITF